MPAQCSFVTTHSLVSELTFTFAIYVVVRPSVVCLSATTVRPNLTIEIFGNVSTPFGTLAIC